VEPKSVNLFNFKWCMVNQRIGDPAMPIRQDDEDRREFLKACGKFAAVTPPAITMLLSTSLTSKAIATSGAGGVYRDHEGKKGNNGWGNGGGDGSPNGKSDDGR
jgi:hypothetical protein